MNHTQLILTEVSCGDFIFRHILSYFAVNRTISFFCAVMEDYKVIMLMKMAFLVMLIALLPVQSAPIVSTYICSVYP